MKRQNVRIMLAAEYPEVRYFLREVAEAEAGVAIVGQAENATKALTLARHLRPDVAIIDSQLPHAVGLDTVPLSRIGGLDTAQAISEEIPNTRVILLNNLDEAVLPKQSLDSDGGAFFSREIIGTNTPFTLQKLYHEAEQLSTLVFANVEVKPRAVFRQRVSTISDKAVLFGVLGILSGVVLMLTVILAGAGVFLAVAGAATMFLGLMGKLTASLRRKVKSNTKKS